MDSEIRMVRKRFKCNLCDLKQAKLVYLHVTVTKCTICGSIMNEIPEIDSNKNLNQKTRDQVDQTYRIVFDNSNRNIYHNRFDANDTRRSNIDGDTNRKFRRELNNQNSNRINYNLNNNHQNNSNNRTNNSNNNNNFNRNNNRNNDINPNNNFSDYNIYEPTDFRRNSPPNSNFFNYYTRSNNRRNEESKYNNIFSNFFGINNNNNNINSNNINSDNNYYYFDNINNYNDNRNSGNNYYNNRNSNNNTNSRTRSNQNSDNRFFDNFFSDFGLNFPFGESPFFGRITRHNFNDDVFDPGFEGFGSTFNNFFRDNFSSNFRSNFRTTDNFGNIFEILRNSNQENIRPPASQKAISKLKKFKMTDKYCKKDDKGKMEVPNCCICISDISKGEDTVLLPCGHMFHSSCVIEWLKKNNTCPVCRFELPSDT